MSFFPSRILVLAMLLALPAKLALAQAAWEFTPYQARLWIALEQVPQLPAGLVTILSETTARRSAAVWGPVLQVQTAASSGKLSAELLQRFAELTADTVTAAADKADLEADKIYLVAIRSGADSSFDVRVRELDGRSRQLGPVITRSTATLAALPAAVWDAVAESFTPLARIEQLEGRHVVARLRAGGLASGAASPVLIEPGMVLRPIVRRNDRTGQPLKGGVQAIPWSFMTVEERHDAVLECTMQSGYRAAIPARGGVRLERLALLVRPQHETTRLLLRSRTEPTKPLVGYEVHRRQLGQEETQLLGMTDEHGAINVPKGDGSLDVCLIKNGKQLLARLPVVPGQEETLTANVVDDDPRLTAEGFVAALSSRALDLVARREILAAQIRARLKAGKADEAQRVLDEFRRLESRAELSRDLDRFRQQITTTDKLTQTRIDKLLADAQKFLLLKPLSDDLLAQLTRDVSAARAGGE